MINIKGIISIRYQYLKEFNCVQKNDLYQIELLALDSSN